MKRKFFVPMKVRSFILAAAVIGFVASVTLLPACNVTRVMSTETSCFQRGDTSVTIVTKTIETYDAYKRQ